MMLTRLSVLLLFWPFCSVVQAERPLFDAHLHYDAADARVYSPPKIIARLRENAVSHALVTSSPAGLATSLYEVAPHRIVPFLGVYREYADKEDWHQNEGLADYVAEQLKQGLWQGIGELHLFAEHRHSPVLRELAELAVRHEVPLLMHADPAVIDTLFANTPQVVVFWAHAGTFPYPDLVADYLERYPNLYIDLSMRDGRIAPRGKLADPWYELFIRHPTRFLVGVDTYSTARWRNFGGAVATIRQWLSQLPADVRRRLAYQNATRLLRPGKEQP